MSFIVIVLIFYYYFLITGCKKSLIQVLLRLATLVAELGKREQQNITKEEDTVNSVKSEVLNHI